MDRTPAPKAGEPAERAAAQSTDIGRNPAFTPRWAASFEAFRAWVLRTGSLPRRSSADRHEAKLAGWLNGQRVRYRAGGMQACCVEALKSVPGALTDRTPARRSDRMGDLAAFVDAHARLPRRTGNEDESSLAHYLTGARKRWRTGQLGPALKARFEAIPGAAGGYLPQRPVDAAGRVEQLRAFTREHGHFLSDAPGAPVPPPGLRAWVNDVVNHGRDPESLAEVLRLREATPTFREATFHIELAAVEEYARAHGMRPPASERDLYQSLVRARLRLRRGDLDETVSARVQALLDLPGRTKKTSGRNEPGGKD